MRERTKEEESLRLVLAQPSQALRAMRRIANGSLPNNDLEAKYHGMFHDDFDAFDKALRSAEKDFRGEAAKAIREAEEGGVPNGTGAIKDQGQERIEETIIRLLQEAAE